MAWADTLLKFAAASLAILAYYGVVANRFTASAGRIADYLYRIPRFRKYARYDLESVIRLGVAGIGQLLFMLALLLFTRIEPAQLAQRPFDPYWLLYGVLLGIGETCFASFAVAILIEGAMLWFPRQVPARLEDWQQVFAGGWMQTLLKTEELVPLPLALVLIGLYVAVEEIIFRGILITWFRPDDPLLALGISLLLFVVYQVFNMPSLQNAIAPLCGALLIGCVHGLLFLAVPEIVPLILAHCVLFIAATRA